MHQIGLIHFTEPSKVILSFVFFVQTLNPLVAVQRDFDWITTDDPTALPLFSVSFKLILNSIILLGTCGSLNRSCIPHVPVSLHTRQTCTHRRCTTDGIHSTGTFECFYSMVID